jgi:hypothetical protein
MTGVPFGHAMPGIIIIDARSWDDIGSGLESLLLFLSRMPFPNTIVADAKFKVSNEGIVMRGRDARTRVIKTLRISEGTTFQDVWEHFGLVENPS